MNAWGLRAAYASTVVAIAAVVMLGTPYQRSTALVVNAVLTTTVLVASCHWSPSRYRMAWYLRTIASVLYGSAGLWMHVQRYVLGGSGQPAVGMVLLIVLGQVTLLTSLISLLVRRGLPLRGQLADLGVISVGIAVPVHVLVVDPLVMLRTSGLVSAYLVGSIVLNGAGLMVMAWLALAVGGRIQTLNLVTASTAFFAASSLIIAVVQGGDATRDLNRWSAVCFVASDLCIALAALGGRPAMRPKRDLQALPGFGPWRVAALVVALCLPAATGAVAQVLYGHVNVTAIVVPTAVMALLCVIRARGFYVQSQEAAARIAVQERYFRALVGNVSEVVVVTDAKGRYRDRTPAFDAAFGAPDEGSTIGSVLAAPTSIAELLTEAALSRGRTVIREVETIDAAGVRHWCEASVCDLSHNDDVRGFVWVLRDVDERRRFTEQLKHQALHDALTGLPNRALLSDRLHTTVARARREQRVVSVLFVDLDNFKLVNDSLGHEAGDQLLQGVAARLQVAVRDHDTVARLGGDEFAVVVEHSDARDGEAVAQKLLNELRCPIDVSGTQVPITASIGVATGSPDVPEDLLRNADLAMYHAKAAGKNTAQAFEAAMHAAAVERLQLEVDLAGAVAGGDLFVLYQPVVSLASGSISGFEALVRWQHPTRGVVPPAQFIPIAESNGAILEIGRFVLNEACEHATSWPEELQIAVNVSPAQLEHLEFAGHVRQALDRSGLHPSRLILEVTESSLVRDVAATNRQLTGLKAIGVRIAIDDFGTGYSSLSQLQNLPIDILKIDRAFVNAMQSGPEARAVVKALIDMGGALNLDTIAEGVEDLEQAGILLDHRCAEAQGFLYARPLEPAETHEFIAEGLPCDIASVLQAVATC